jgi:hypothetical protein
MRELYGPMRLAAVFVGVALALLASAAMRTNRALAQNQRFAPPEATETWWWAERLDAGCYSHFMSDGREDPHDPRDRAVAMFAGFACGGTFLY